MAEYVAYVSRIALGSVVDEDFLWAEMNAACRVIVFDNGINQKVITLFRTVSAECLGISHLIHCLVHRFDANLRQRTGNVSDTQTDDFFFRVRYPESINFLAMSENK